MRNRATLVIADDHEIVRSGLRDALLQPGMMPDLDLSLLAEAANGFETLAAIKQHQPDLLLLDISMPLASGAEILQEIRRWSPATRIVVYTAVSSAGLLSGLVSSGVDGLFSKGANLAELHAKLPLIARGGRYICRDFEALIADDAGKPALTPREHQTLNMVIAGKTNREIAAAMHISVKTVEKHRTSLLAKLDVHSVAELLAYALRENLIDHQSLSGR